MKRCPTCKRTYADETLTFCLVDGSVLSAPYDPNATLQLPDPRTTDSPIAKPPPQSTILALQQPNLYAEKQQPRLHEKQGGRSWLMIGLALTCVSLVGVSVIFGLLWLRKDSAADTGPNSNVAKTSPTPAATPSDTPDATPSDSPTATPTATIENDGWERHAQTSINEGDRLTYYPTTTVEACEADCNRNRKCRAYTYIKAGFYNPNDPPMCYLMSAVKTLNASTCCFSAIKR